MAKKRTLSEVNTRCHLMSLVVACCHSLSLVVLFAVTSYYSLHLIYYWIYHSTVSLLTILGKDLKIKKGISMSSKKSIIWQNWQRPVLKIWNPASANLACDFIRTVFHHGHIVAECFDFFSLRMLLHKIALITCITFLNEPNQILMLIGLRITNLRNRNIHRKLF